MTTTIFLIDNGRALCEHHLGVSASMTGRDISGQPIMRLSPDDVRDSIRDDKWHPACEVCGTKASTLLIVEVS